MIRKVGEWLAELADLLYFLPSAEARQRKEQQERAHRSRDAIAITDGVLGRLGSPPEPPPRQIAAAFLKKGAALNLSKRHEEAAAVYDKLIAFIDAAADPALSGQLARSAEKGGQNSGDRPLAGRPDNQDPRAHRRTRAPVRPDAHTRKCF